MPSETSRACADQSVEELRSELAEAREQQIATAQILAAISSSPTDPSRVVAEIAASAARLCDAYDAAILQLAGDHLLVLAVHGPLLHIGPVGQGKVPLERGILVARAVIDKKTIHVADLQAETQEYPAGSDLARRFGHRTIVAVPLIRSRDAIGAITVRRNEVRPFTDRQIDLLKTFANQAVIAIENTRLFEQVQVRTRELTKRTQELTETLEYQTATSEVLGVISRSPTNAQPVFDTIAKAAAVLCSAQFCNVYRYDGQLIHIVATHLPASPELREINLKQPPILPGQGSAAARSIASISIAEVPDIGADPDYELSELAKAGRFRSTMAVPMLKDGRPIGAIAVARPQAGRFPERQIALLQTFANQAVIAIENARLFEAEQTSKRGLQESLEYQTAASEVLNVISRSPTNAQPVFDAIAQSARRLGGGYMSAVYRFDGTLIHNIAHHNWTVEGIEALSRVYPRPPGSETQIAKAILDGKVVHVPDIEAPGIPEPSLIIARALGYRSLLAVPMLKDGNSVGAIAIVRGGGAAPFSEAQIDLVKTFADQAVIAIENTRLFEAEQTRTKEVEAKSAELRESLEYQTATSEVLSVISRSPNDVKPVLDTIARIAQRLCQAEHAFVLQRQDEGYRLVAANDALPDWVSAIKANPLRPGRGSLTGRVALERRTVHVEDLRADPEYTLGPTLQHGVRSELGVPLMRDGEVIGVIIVGRTEVRPFTDRQIALIETFADQAVIAIENARLFEEVQARTRALQESLEYQTAMSDVLGVISSSPDKLQPVLDAIVNTAKRICIADRAYFNVLLEGRYHSVAATEGIPKHIIDDVRAKPEAPGRGSHAARAVLEKRPIHIEDTRLDPEFTLYDANEPGRARTLLGVPLLRRDEVIGVITLARVDPAPFTQRQIDLVATFANQAVIAINNVDLFEEVQARTRELTEALQQQTATADVLKVISRSTFNLQTVLDTLVESAARLCVADTAAIWRPNGDTFQFLAHHAFNPEYRTLMERYPVPVGRGSIAGRTLLEGRPVQVADLLADPEYAVTAAARRGKYRTLLGVPLMREGTPMGVITLQRSTVEPFTDKQIELLMTFADQAVIAIENTRLFNETKEALERQTATAEILRVIASTPDNAQPVFDAIAQSALRVFGVFHTAVMLREGDFIRSKATAGIPDPRGGFLIPLERESTAGICILDRLVSNISDTEAPDAPTFARDSGRVVGFRAIAAAPMLREGVAIGSVHMMRKPPGAFTTTQIELLKTFADQAVIAIENTRLFEEVQARTRELARSVQELTALGEVGRAVSSTLDLRIVLKTVVERAVQLSGTDAGSIFYYHNENGSFELGETIGLTEAVIASLRRLEISANESGPGEAIVRRQPLQIPDLTQHPSDPLRDAVLEAGFRASLIVPLLGAETPLGALVLRRRHPGEFPAGVVTLMQSFADQSAIALENARLFEEIARKSRELEIASQHKSQFVANMSHELRTPLAAILGYAELMQEGFYGNQSGKSMDTLTRIRSNGKHLLGLINTVLDIAKIESGQFTLNMTEYAMESVVETVRSATESLAQNKKLVLKTDVAKSLPIGLGDEQRLTQVLLNLVGNAIKFTDTGEVRVTAKGVNGHFNVSVTDTGPGIPVEHQARIFEQFHQVDSSNTKAKGGTGLGLAIAKQIVEMHGGRIWVESTLGKGSTFRMELPTRAELRKPPS